MGGAPDSPFVQSVYRLGDPIPPRPLSDGRAATQRVDGFPEDGSPNVGTIQPYFIVDMQGRRERGAP
jgi:hypothetical protein